LIFQYLFGVACGTNHRTRIRDFVVLKFVNTYECFRYFEIRQNLIKFSLCVYKHPAEANSDVPVLLLLIINPH